MKLTKFASTGFLAAALLSAGCVNTADHRQAAAGPETLIVHTDGRMEYRNRLMPDDDVIIYEDGLGGERAAVRVRVEPLHPDFFRDSIAVERR